MSRTIHFEGRTVTVPDDASDEELQAILSSAPPGNVTPPGPVQGAPPQAGEPQPPIATRQAIERLKRMSGPGRFAMGVARPVFELGYGAKQLLGGELSPEQQHQLAVLRNNPGLAGGSGRVAGEVASFAVPGGAASRLATKAATSLPRVAAWAAPVVADVLATSGVEALKAPEEGKTRTRSAVEGGAAAVAGRTLLAPVAPFLRGVRHLSDDAREFLRQHPEVVPTLGQLKGGWAKAIEERAKALPFVGEQIKRREREAVEQWNRNVVERALPPPSAGAGPMPRPTLPASTRTGQESIAHVQDRFGDAYAQIFRGKSFDLDSMRTGLPNFTQVAHANLPPDAAARVTARAKQLDSELSSKTPGHAVERIDDELRELVQTAQRNGYPDEAAMYQMLRDGVRGGLPPGTRQRLKDVDAAYRQWVPVERAAAYKGAADAEGVFTPSQLLGASRASSDTVRKRGFAAGKAPQQQEAQRASRVLGNELPQPGPGTAEKVLAPLAFLSGPKAWAALGAGMVPYSRTGQKMLAGKYPWQPKLKTLSEILAEGGVTPGTFGAAVED